MAIGRTYDQVAPPFVRQRPGWWIGWCVLFDRCREHSVPAWTKAVPSALLDRYREAYRRVAQGRTWGRVGG